MAQNTSSQSLSIEALEADLQYALHERDKATAARLKAQDAENQWVTEVTSLTNLIEVRRKRLQPSDGALHPPSDVDFQDDLKEIHELAEEPVSHVDWIMNNVAASGNRGISPPELLQMAELEGRKMHRNYPYIVLRKLVEDGKATKKAGRYYKKGT